MTAEKREKIIRLIIAVMVGVIIVQVIAMVILFVSVGRVKTMYKEALNERVEIREDVGKNYAEGGEEDLPPRP